MPEEVPIEQAPAQKVSIPGSDISVISGISKDEDLPDITVNVKPGKSDDDKEKSANLGSSAVNSGEEDDKANKIELANLVFTPAKGDDLTKLQEALGISDGNYSYGTLQTASGEYELGVAIGQDEDKKIFLNEEDIKKIYKEIKKHNEQYPNDKRAFHYEFKDKVGQTYAKFKINESGGMKILEGKEFFVEGFDKKINTDLGVNNSVDSGVKTEATNEENKTDIEEGLSKKQQELIVGLLKNVKERIFGKEGSDATNSPELIAFDKMINDFKSGAITASFQESGFAGQNQDIANQLNQIAQTDVIAAEKAGQDKASLSNKLHHQKHSTHNKKPQIVISKNSIRFPSNDVNNPKVIMLNKDEKEFVDQIKTATLKDEVIKALSKMTPSHGEALGNLHPSPSPSKDTGPGRQRQNTI